jgi:hypothetical protein
MSRTKPLQKEEVTFFEKKVTKKTFGPVSVGTIISKARRTESLFASFSSEKEVLSYSP